MACHATLAVGLEVPDVTGSALWVLQAWVMRYTRTSRLSSCVTCGKHMQALWQAMKEFMWQRDMREVAAFVDQCHERQSLGSLPLASQVQSCARDAAAERWWLGVPCWWDGVLCTGFSHAQDAALSRVLCTPSWAPQAGTVVPANDARLL